MGWAIGFACFAQSSAFADEISYKNDRFGTVISFPANLYEHRAELPTNGDGVLFFSDDGGSIAIWAGHNALESNPRMTADEMRKQVGESFSITYERIEKDWMVQSGFDGDLIYYHRIEFGADGIIHGFLMKWPRDLRNKYDDHVGSIGKSLGPN